MTEENLADPGYTTADQDNTTPLPPAAEPPATPTSIEETQRPPIAGAPLSVVLVAYNDGPSVASVVADWVACMNRLSREYEILLVDDGSTDGTGDLADSLASAEARLKILRHDTHQGIGAASGPGLAAPGFRLFPTRRAAVSTKRPTWSDCSRGSTKRIWWAAAG